MSYHTPILIVEVGSTLTKIHAFDRDGSHLGAGNALTTIETGIMQGVNAAMRQLAGTLGAQDLEWERLYANSSAAGGLRMSVHGLTYDMTARAGREACLGAGAILVQTTAGAVMPDDIRELERIQPNLIFICGGVDNGDREVTGRNIAALAKARTNAPVIYAGNQVLRAAATRAFQQAGKTLVCTANVYPAVDQLDVQPAREIIQRMFAEHIIHAKGMDQLAAIADAPIIPTPAAVLAAGNLIHELAGDTLIVDIGGATTDVHSITNGSEQYRDRMLAPEPLAKRTVEGDLGVYINARQVAGHVPAGDSPLDWTALRALPVTENEKQISRRLMEHSLTLGITRHAGRLINQFSAQGRETWVQGRDLTAIRNIIGTGGALIRLGIGQTALEQIRIARVHDILLPTTAAQVMLDEDYLLAALGTIAAHQTETARAALSQYLPELHPAQEYWKTVNPLTIRGLSLSQTILDERDGDIT